MPASPAVLSTSPTFPATGAIASVAMQSVNATVVLWSELVRNQTAFSLRVLEVMTKQPQSGGSPTLESIGASRRVDPQVEPAEEVSPVLAAPRKKSTAPASSNDLAAANLPVKRYDALTVQAIVAKLDRLRDPAQVRAVIAYERSNKARKGVLAAGEARIRRLRDR